MKSARDYLDRASAMRELARNTEIKALQASCLRAAARYEGLARDAQQMRHAHTEEREDE